MITSVYVDGFNLYRSALRGTPYRWLDLETLCRLLMPGDDIRQIRYFTARLKPLPTDLQAPQRQQMYLRALETLDLIAIHYGQFRTTEKWRPRVGSEELVRVRDTHEKGSDVNLATFLIHDGHRDLFEQAVVISNDSDLAEPVRIVRDALGKPVVVVNPQKTDCKELRQNASSIKRIREGLLRASQFPNDLEDAVGRFHKPPGW